MKSVKNLEMINHVSPMVAIDAFQAKLGRDEDVSVVQFQTDNKDVAADLVDFIESGHKSVLDADHSPAKNQQKKYNVFVELERNDDLPKNVVRLVRDVENVTGMMPWQFTKTGKVTHSEQPNISKRNLSKSNFNFFTFIFCF